MQLRNLLRGIGPLVNIAVSDCLLSGSIVRKCGISSKFGGNFELLEDLSVEKKGVTNLQLVQYIIVQVS